MENLKRFESINDYNIFNQKETLHPLVSVIDFETIKFLKTNSDAMRHAGHIIHFIFLRRYRHGCCQRNGEYNGYFLSEDLIHTDNLC